MNMKEIDAFIEKCKNERKQRRAGEKPLREECAKEIREYVGRVLKDANDRAIEDRAHGILRSYEWHSVGQMAQVLRQTSKRLVGDLFFEFSMSDQRMIVRNVLESLWREGVVDRAIGLVDGRECLQYVFKRGA